MVTSACSFCGYWASSNDKLYWWYFWPKLPSYPLYTHLGSFLLFWMSQQFGQPPLIFCDAQKNDKFHMMTSLNLLFYTICDQLWFKFTFIERKVLGSWMVATCSTNTPTPPPSSAGVPLASDAVHFISPHRLLLRLPHNLLLLLLFLLFLLLLPFLAPPFCFLFHKFLSQALSFCQFTKFTFASPTNKPKRVLRHCLLNPLCIITSFIVLNSLSLQFQFLSPKYPPSCPLSPMEASA